MLDTRKMLGYHKPKNYKQLFIVEHVVTLTISMIAATCLQEAIESFSATNHVPKNHIRVYLA